MRTNYLREIEDELIDLISRFEDEISSQDLNDAEYREYESIEAQLKGALEELTLLISHIDIEDEKEFDSDFDENEY